jgi:predicted enzyme related to lactoylglutathione lyase
MKLTSLRIITADLKPLVQFFEQVTGLTAQWYTEDFAEIITITATLAIGSTRTMQLFGEGLIRPASNNSVIIEFRVANVDDEFNRIKDLINDIVQVPTTIPMGQSFHANPRSGW